MLNNFHYSDSIIPKKYFCSKCGKTHVKLWRRYQSVNLELLCAECASVNQQKDISTMDENGTCSGKLGSTDQIGWYIPAVPDEEGLGYWGYTSVPEEGVNWWKKLPNK